jgi:hypothetical protein
MKNGTHKGQFLQSKPNRLLKALIVTFRSKAAAGPVLPLPGGPGGLWTRGREAEDKRSRQSGREDGEKKNAERDVLRRYLVRKRSAYLTAAGGQASSPVKRYNSHPGIHFCPQHGAVSAAIAGGKAATGVGSTVTRVGWPTDPEAVTASGQPKAISRTRDK